jgi:flavorubredoxin
LILDAYRDWASELPKNEVLLGYVSMHGSTERMAAVLIDSLSEHGVTVRPFNLVTSSLGDLAAAAVDAATICIATPAFLVGPHPTAVYAAYLLNALKPKAKFLTIIGSYSWGSKMVEQLTELLGNIKAEIVPPVLVKGMPQEKDFEALKQLAGVIAEKHRSAGLGSR